MQLLVGRLKQRFWNPRFLMDDRNPGAAPQQVERQRIFFTVSSIYLALYA